MILENQREDTQLLVLESGDPQLAFSHCWSRAHWGLSLLICPSFQC